jgi:hypothetical protein
MSDDEKGFGVYGVRVKGVGDAWQFMKIGMTGDWETRKRSLHHCVKPFVGWGTVVQRFWIPADTETFARGIERELHIALSNQRTVGEWFAVPPMMDEALSIMAVISDGYKQRLDMAIEEIETMEEYDKYAAAQAARTSPVAEPTGSGHGPGDLLT